MNSIRSYIIGLDSKYTGEVREISEQQFHDIVKYVSKLNIYDYDIYEDLCRSKTNDFPDSRKTQELLEKMNELAKKHPFLGFQGQGQNYCWVDIKKDEKEQETFRYYLGINPRNMYDLVEKLTEKFASKGIPLSFKYQREGKRKMADRIIIYTGYNNRPMVEQTIREIYSENRELFNDTERILPWIYNTEIPGVFLAPESQIHDKSYGENFASALTSAKAIYYYLYCSETVTNKDQLEMLKKIVASTMFRNGLLMSIDGKRILPPEAGIKTFYDARTGTLMNCIDNKETGYYYEVVYDNTDEGKRALLNNFYTVSNVPPQPGATPRKLTQEMRIIEIHNKLYPDKPIPVPKI